MKQILLALFFICVSIFIWISIGYRICNKSNDSMSAVIVGPSSGPGKIVKFIDADHIYVSTDDDTIPEYIASAFDRQYVEDIAYQQKQKKLDSITVTVRTINGKGPYIIDYIYNFFPYQNKSLNLNVPFATTNAVAGFKDKLYVIDLISTKVDHPENPPRFRGVEIEIGHLSLVRNKSKLLIENYRDY